jgi:RNA polymerase sigma-70 factor (ECF subfamily)
MRHLQAVDAGPTDEALLAGMALGDEQAGVVFVRRYQRRVFGLALGMVGDPTLAEDVAQEALIRAWKHAPVYDARRGGVATWVLTIARNLSIDALRARRSVPIDPDDLVGLGLLSSDRSPEDMAVANDAASEIRAALSTLPAEQRRALVLAGLYGHTAAEVGVAEGIPLGTAKTRIRSGMLKLRAAMATKESLR